VRREGAPRALCAGRRRLVHVRLQLAVRPGVVEVAGGLHILDERRARVAEHGVAHHGAPACGTPRGSPSGPRRARISSQRRAVRPASKQPAIDAPWPRTAGSAASSTAQLSPACNPARALRVEPLRAMASVRPRCGAALLRSGTACSPKHLATRHAPGHRAPQQSSAERIRACRRPSSRLPAAGCPSPVLQLATSGSDPLWYRCRSLRVGSLAAPRQPHPLGSQCFATRFAESSRSAGIPNA